MDNNGKPGDGQVTHNHWPELGDLKGSPEDGAGDTFWVLLPASHPDPIYPMGLGIASGLGPHGPVWLGAAEVQAALIGFPQLSWEQLFMVHDLVG